MGREGAVILVERASQELIEQCDALLIVGSAFPYIEHIASPARPAVRIDRDPTRIGAALIEAVVDPNEPLLPPKHIERYAKNHGKTLDRGTPGADEIRRAQAREPALTMLQD